MVAYEMLLQLSRKDCRRGSIEHLMLMQVLKMSSCVQTNTIAKPPVLLYW